METKKWGKAILFGLITIFVMALVTSLIFSLLLKFTSLTESSITWLILGLSILALFIGGFVAGGNGKEKGWLIGGITAILFSLIILLFKFLGHGEIFSVQELMYHGGFLLIAMLGGIFGVNVSSSRT
ncbi:TIGR04086 family membrane protein [Metabacillus halosaccharovorans]|uniref:TIGR04086 family membrane protein n=1 Tax=Metabacillus halosaccharovorans TaxID=930124 RepID=A0ABT3DDW0_9BACI|nr:TIGR04086 family membrane protein [Metabacillus halosaccharovorans]MCV9885247.1 TIGR04086 family membrane protein [Metabacillus halosaccharovorans]